MPPVNSITESATVYVTTDGSDSNNGLTWAAAFATISAAIAALPAGGGIVEVGYGTFTSGTAITAVPSLTLRGRGQNATTITQSSTSHDGIDGTDIRFLVVRDLTLSGPGSGTGTGIKLTLSAHAATGYCSFMDATVTGFGSDGINIQTPIVCRFERVTSSANGGDGFSLHSTGTSCHLASCYALSNGGYGYNLNAVRYMELSGCASDSCANGYIVNASYGVALDGCGAESYTTNGFILNGSRSITVNACYTYANNHYALWLTGGGACINNTIIGFQEDAPTGSAVASITMDSGTQAFIGAYTVVTATSLSPSSHYTLLSAGGITATDNCFFDAKVYVSNNVLEQGAGCNTGIEPPPNIVPTFANGTAAQLSDTTRDYMVYFQIGTGGTNFTLKIDSVNPPTSPIIVNGATVTSGQVIAFRLPGGWYVLWSATTATLADQIAVGC